MVVNLINQQEKNIKDLIKTINKKYKDKTNWNLKNIEKQYEKAKINPKILENKFINTNQVRKKEDGETISDKLSICSKWNNVRQNNYTDKSGPYLDKQGNINKGNLSAEALACAYWSYHKKTTDPKNPIRQIEITPNRGTDIADGVYIFHHLF